MVGTDASGGSAALGELIDNHGAALYSDFHTYYHIDLAEAIYGERKSRIEPRLLLSMVENLPEGSSFVAQMSGGIEHRPWSTQTYLLANIVNAVNSNTLVLANAPESVRKKVGVINGPHFADKTRNEEQSANAAFLKRFGII